MNRRLAPKGWDPIAGLWKLFCALAILVGHHLVTYIEWREPSGLVRGVYQLLQVVSPLHFFFFSGWLAASGLVDIRRPMAGLFANRFLRIYVLVVFALSWGLLWRVAMMPWTGDGSLGTIWPLGSWDRPISWDEILRHLSPAGFADSIRYNYASWYLYQELRLVFLFPVFRWILRRSAMRSWILIAAVWLTGSVGEYFFWASFPGFRTSPFQTLAYASILLCGARLKLDLPLVAALSWPSKLLLVASGLVLTSLEAFGIRPPIDNPGVLLLPTLVGQLALVAGLATLPGRVRWPWFAEFANRWSVGIYVVHPPVHMAFAWLAIREDRSWLLFASIPIGFLLGVLFHHAVENPLHNPLRRLVAGMEQRFQASRVRSWWPKGKLDSRDVAKAPDRSSGKG